MELNDFMANFPTNYTSSERNFIDTLANTFNGARMGNSAIIGATSAAMDNSFVANVGGFLNGVWKSDSDSLFGKVFDGVKGAVEANIVKKLVELFPPEMQNIAALGVAVLGKFAGNHLDNVQKENEMLISSQLATNPAVAMMQGYGRDAMLDAAKEAKSNNLNDVKDPEIRNHFKMT